MSDATIAQSGEDFTSMNAFIGDGGTSATDTGTIVGTWTVKDTTDVTWNKAVIIVADSDSKQIGRPWKAGDTHYQLNGDAAGHLFTVTADVDITDIDIQGVSSSTSDEIFRTSSAASLDVTRCLIGFAADGGDDQQDVAYAEWDSATEAFNFTQCQFYNIGRSIVDLYNANSTITINFNSCGSYKIAEYGGRNDGAWVGIDEASVSSIITVNAQNCLMDVSSTGSQNAFGRNYASSGTFAIECDNFIFSEISGLVSANEDTENLSNGTYSAAWVAGNPTSGQVGVISVTTPFDLSLFDDSADNAAQDQHATATGANSGLTIPGTDIVGTSRPQNTNYDVGPFEVAVAGPGGLSIPVAMHHYMHNLG